MLYIGLGETISPIHIFSCEALHSDFVSVKANLTCKVYV